jgi:hypothetical protein
MGCCDHGHEQMDSTYCLLYYEKLINCYVFKGLCLMELVDHFETEMEYGDVVKSTLS